MNDRDLHSRASALFLDLRGLPSEERERRLGEVSDERLRRAARELLDHDDGASAEGTSVAGGGAGDADRDGDLPARIGPYTVLRRLGRGGSGYVLLAEQHAPIHRMVAIKVVPYAAVNPDSAARFEFERRALERTDHPNIAGILDAGRTPDGLPYLVIEYVEGEPLSDYCRDRRLSVRERIGLVLDVAEAVQHAHQRGVIHRDLKPANILVSETSGRATPRVLDFGIAKPTEAFGSDAMVTSGVPMGTPAFMAPEQTGGRPVDTRADIYSLGAVLYHLVAGRPPIDATGDTADVLRRIRETIPPPASRASLTGTEGLARSLVHDLDLVLAKALEKEPERRYETVAAMAEDLRRVLRREPVLAHPPTLRYRAARFAQRNRGLVAAAAIVLVAAVLGVGGLGLGLFEADRQRREATNQTEAQREINRFLTDDLLAAASPEKEGHDISALDLLRRASTRIGSRFHGRPLIAAAVHHTLGVTFSHLGSFADAERHLELALSLRRAHAGADAPDTVRTEIASASLIARRAQYDKAEAPLRACIDRARLILGADDPAVYSALNDLGLTMFTLGRGKEAVGVLQESLAGCTRLLGDRDPMVLEVTSNLAQAYEVSGETERSIQLHLDALRVADSIADPPRMILIGLNNNLGATYQDLNRDQEAAPYLRKAAELGAKWLTEDNPDRWTLQGNLASLEAELGHPEEGARLYEEVIKARSRIMGPETYDTMSARYGYWNCVWIGKRFDEAAAGYSEMLPECARALGEKHWLTVQTRSSLAKALYDGKRYEEALPHAEKAAEAFEALYGPDHPRAKNTLRLRADVRAKLGK